MMFTNDADHDMEEDVITLTGEDGVEQDFYLVDILDVRDQQVAILHPVNDGIITNDDDGSETVSIFLLLYTRDGDDEYFDEIEDESLFTEAREACSTYLTTNDFGIDEVLDVTDAMDKTNTTDTEFIN